MSLNRPEVSRHVSTAFIGGAASRFDLIALARVNRASPEILSALHGLPERRFERLLDLWDQMPQVEAA